MSDTAVIMAGGLGTRLRPYTVVLPKPLMPLGDKPILGLIIGQLANNGFKRIILAVNHQADIIKAYFGEGSDWGVNIEYVLEKKRLGTMGPLSLIENLPETFLVMNGDVLTDLNYSKFLAEHAQSGYSFSISASNREQQIDYGVLETNSGKLVSMLEKPIKHFLVSMGIYAVNKDILALIPINEYFGFDNLMAFCLEGAVNVGVVPHEGYWLDIGRPDDYMKAIDDVEKNKDFFC